MGAAAGGALAIWLIGMCRYQPPELLAARHQLTGFGPVDGRIGAGNGQIQGQKTEAIAATSTLTDSPPATHSTEVLFALKMLRPG